MWLPGWCLSAITISQNIWDLKRKTVMMIWHKLKQHVKEVLRRFRKYECCSFWVDTRKGEFSQSETGFLYDLDHPLTPAHMNTQTKYKNRLCFPVLSQSNWKPTSFPNCQTNIVYLWQKQLWVLLSSHGWMWNDAHMSTCTHTHILSETIHICFTWWDCLFAFRNAYDPKDWTEIIHRLQQASLHSVYCLK